MNPVPHLLGLLAALAALTVAVRPPAAPPAPPPTPVLELRTDHLPDPVALGGAAVTRFVLRLTDDRGTLTVEEDELTFNAFGDATRTGGKAPATLPVELRKADTHDGGFLETVQDVVCADKRFAGRLRLVRSPEPAAAHRLVVRASADQHWSLPTRVLEVRNPAVSADALGRAAQPDRFRFHGLIRNTYSDRSGAPLGTSVLQEVTVGGSLADGGELHLDPNGIHFSATGRVGGGTLVARESVRVGFRSLGPDPTGKGRRVFSLVGPTGDPLSVEYSRDEGGPRTFALVLAPTEPGPHRLVVSSGGRVRQLVVLRDVDRDGRLYRVEQRLVLPRAERTALEWLIAECGPKLTYMVHDRHVWALTDLTGDVSKLDPLLPAFPKLAHVTFSDSTMPPEGLASLRRLPELRSIRFEGRLPDAAVKSFAAAPGLHMMQLYPTAGFTRAGLRALAGVKGLSHLQLHVSPPADADADEWFRELAAFTELQQLQVFGTRPTDAGLVHLRPLTKLTGLTVGTGGRVTEAGLRHLLALPALHSIYLFDAQWPADARARFLAARPNAQVFTAVGR